MRIDILDFTSFQNILQMFPTIFSVKPLDYISDHLRHPANLMIDIYKHPDEVLRAVDVITDLTIKFLRQTVPPLVNMAPKLFSGGSNI